MSAANCCLLWRGTVYAGPALNANGSGYGECSFANQNLSALPYGAVRLPTVASLGNISEFYISTNRQEFETVDYTGSGEGCTADIVTGRSINFTLNCFNQEAFNLAFGTEKTIRSAQSVTAEDVGICGALYEICSVTPFALAPININQPVTVWIYDTLTNVSTALVPDVDYKVTIAGVEWLRTITLASSQRLRASYTSASTDTHYESDCPVYRSLIFVGKNKVDSCSSSEIMAIFYRVKLKTSERFDMIHSNGFFQAQITGTLEQVNIGGQSKRFTIYPRVTV